MSAPIIRVTDVAFPRFRVPDLDRQEAFLLAFGMSRAARTERALYMRGTDPQHHVYVAELGEPAFLGLAFWAAQREDLAKLAAATGAKVEALDEPGGGEVVRLHDPDGRQIDVVYGIANLEPVPVRSHPPLNTGESRPRVVTLQRVGTGPSQVKRFGHAAIKSTDLERLYAWYHQNLGLIPSDDIYMESPDKPMGRFVRCDRGALPADHHTLLLLETPEVKLGHVAYEVADFDDLMLGHHHLLMESNGGRPYWGIGRHILGGQVFDYWKDPYGTTIEHWTDSDLLVADTAAGSHHILQSLNQWGPMPPPDLDF